MSRPIPLISPAEAETSAAASPVVDLATGGVIAIHGPISAARGTRLPLIVDIPAAPVIGGSANLSSLHEAVRASGRRPREVILTIGGGFSPADRQALLAGIDGLRAIGYLIAIGDLGAGPVPLDLLADVAPYLITLSPDLVARAPRDPRRAALGASIAAMAAGVGAHLLATGVSSETRLAAVHSWGVRLACGPLLTPGPSGRVRVPLPVPKNPPVADAVLGPRAQEMLLPAVTLPQDAMTDEAIDLFSAEPSLTSVILVDEYQRPTGSLDRGRFLLTVAGRYGHALHAGKPVRRLADPPRTVPRTTPAVAAMQVASRDDGRVYDDLVVVDEMGRCLGIVRVSDLIRHVARR